MLSTLVFENRVFSPNQNLGVEFSLAPCGSRHVLLHMALWVWRDLNSGLHAFVKQTLFLLRVIFSAQKMSLTNGQMMLLFMAGIVLTFMFDWAGSSCRMRSSPVSGVKSETGGEVSVPSTPHHLHFTEGVMSLRAEVCALNIFAACP